MTLLIFLVIIGPIAISLYKWDGLSSYTSWGALLFIVMCLLFAQYNWHQCHDLHDDDACATIDAERGSDP